MKLSALALLLLKFELILVAVPVLALAVSRLVKLYVRRLAIELNVLRNPMRSLP